MADSNAAVATELYPQRWLCLVGMVIVLFTMQFSLIIMPGIAPYIMQEMQLTPAQFGLLANTPYLAGLLSGIITGNWGDRIGIKKIMIFAICFFIVGAWWRAFAHSFLWLFVSSLVMGFGLAVMNANSTKGIRLWFPGKNMGIAMGIYVAGASIGAGVALKCGALWGTKTSLLVSAIASLVAMAVWVFMYKTHPAESGDKSSTVGMDAFKAVMKDKNVWLVSLMIMFVFGISTTAQTYMNASLGILSGGNMGLVGTIALVSTIFVALSSIFGPAVVARFKTFRGVMIAACAILAAFTASILFFPFGIATWITIIGFSLFMGVILAMGKTVPALLPGIDPRNLGAVGGLQSTLQNLGGWLICGYIIAPIAQSMYPSVDGGITFGLNCYQAIYIGAAICILLAAVCIFLLPKNTPSHLEIGEE